MAHEFNNPLGIIMGFVEDMMSTMIPSDPNYRSLQIVDEETNLCGKIVRDLMELGRPERYRVSLDLDGGAIDKALQLVKNRLYKQKVTLGKTLKPDLPRIYADQQQLEQVLINLYLNALDAMPDGGKLLVEAEVAHLNGSAPWS